MKKEVIQIISRLKNGEITIRDIPEELSDNTEIISTERKIGLRKNYRCGFDVINNRFFVEEDVIYDTENPKWFHTEPRYFDDFNSYYKYLNGNIYENACYYQLNPKLLPKGINQKKLFERKAFIDYTIDDFVLSTFKDCEQEKYDEAEKRKKEIQGWIKKFNKCTTYQKFKMTIENYRRSSLRREVDESFYFWNYIFEDVDDKNRFQIIMEYMSSGIYPTYKIIDALSIIYNPDAVLENYKYALGSYNTRRKRIRELRDIIEAVKNNQYKYKVRKYFDSATHFYCVETSAHFEGYSLPSFSSKRYFDSFHDFIDFLNGNLVCCDLSHVQHLNCDFSQYIIDESTKLPISGNNKYKYSIQKGYRNEAFFVVQKWKSENDSVIKKYEHEFKYLCDILAFLKGDLSHTDLISCDGFKHVVPSDSINLQNALITSGICEKWGITYDRFEMSVPADISFSLTERNELETDVVLQEQRDIMSSDCYPSGYDSYNSSIENVYYISDIHLCHLIKNKDPKSKADVIQIIRKVVSTFIRESEGSNIILINGDTSLDFSIFQLFVSELSRYPRIVIFTIGNHDIWSCPNDTINQLTRKYRALLESHGMYLLQNNVLFFNEYYLPPEVICEKEIKDLPEEELRNKVRSARLVFFGGTGFSGYNQFFNAEYGIYRYNKTIGYNRKKEIKETKKFEALYKKICKAFDGKNTIILTHMPLSDWYEPASKYKKYECSSETNPLFNQSECKIETLSSYHSGFIYVSGHTHRNYYYDDGEIRIYSDNQFGYKNTAPTSWPHLKYFEVDRIVDYFSNFEDGIHEITTDEYKRFYRGKNISMTFTREANIIYMLKKNGYYCFLHKGINNHLSIMNGGALRRLNSKDINYYYDNMDLVIDLISNPLRKYTVYQKNIAEEIKNIGGYGAIHGCIIDINFYNHVYVNPFDGTLAGYWASNIIDKIIYPTIPALLKARCPELFSTYKKMIKGKNKKNMPTISGNQNNKVSLAPVLYLDTDIYKASRQIKKMQKLYSNILTTWPDDLPDRKMMHRQ